MSMTVDDVLGLISISLASVEKQRQGQSAETVGQYLDGYEAALRLLKDMIESSKSK
jgi:hypothetical protein